MPWRSLVQRTFAAAVDFARPLQYDDQADQMEAVMADPKPGSKAVAGGEERQDAEKRQELRELRGRIKELREVIQHLGARRKTLEARQAELAAELGGAHPTK
jgi:chromosome segregation ATPase